MAAMSCLKSPRAMTTPEPAPGLPLLSMLRPMRRLVAR